MYLEDDFQEYNACKNSLGQTSYCKAGNIYSLTKAGAKRVNAEPAKVKRGTITKKDKVSAKFGANSSKDKSCGRMTIDGEPISPKRSCSKYPKRYRQDEELDDDDGSSKKNRKKKKFRNRNKNDGVPRGIDSQSVRLDKLGYPKELRALSKGIVAYENVETGLSQADGAYLRAIIKDELVKVLNAYQQQNRSCSFQQILKGIEAIAIAENPPKP